VLIGARSLDNLDEQLQSLGIERAVLLASSRASSSGAATLVRELAGKRLAGEFTAIRPRAPIEDITRAFEVAEGVRADGLVTVGGGSSIDAAKAVALLLGGVQAASLAGMHTPDEFQSVAPVVAVPTTLSGAETTRGGMFYKDGEKLAFGGDGLGARLIVHDPRQLADVPVAVIASTGMNALAHCLEGLICLSANPITDAMALEGAERLARGMVQLTRDDSPIDVITDLQVGAALGGLCLDTSGIGVHHALCHALGAVYGVAHGASNSVVLLTH
jgi:alcohol dehydrogenase class IV